MLRGWLSNAHPTRRSSALPWLSPGNGSSPALTEFRNTRRTFRPSDFPPPLASSATTPRPVSEIPVGDYVLYNEAIYFVVCHDHDWVPPVVDEEALRYALINGALRSVESVERECQIKETIREMKNFRGPPPKDKAPYPAHLDPIRYIKIEPVFDINNNNNNSNSNSNSNLWVSKVDKELGGNYIDLDHRSFFVRGSGVKDILGGDASISGLSMSYAKGTKRIDDEPFRNVSEERSDVVVYRTRINIVINF